MGSKCLRKADMGKAVVSVGQYEGRLDRSPDGQSREGFCTLRTSCTKPTEWRSVLTVHEVCRVFEPSGYAWFWTTWAEKLTWALSLGVQERGLLRVSAMIRFAFYKEYSDCHEWYELDESKVEKEHFRNLLKRIILGQKPMEAGPRHQRISDYY